MADSIANLAHMQRSEFPIARSRRTQLPKEIEQSERGQGTDFGDAFADALSKTSSEEHTANQMAVQFAEGDPNVGIHDVVIASERANVSLKYTVSLKNKLLEAYREIMNTQV